MEYGTGFVLGLSSNWGGRRVFQGGSAFNGSVALAFGNPGNPLDPALAHIIGKAFFRNEACRMGVLLVKHGSFFLICLRG